MEAQLLMGERLDEVNDHLSLIQKEEGMTFGTDALLLASFVRPCPQGTAIEFGAGSGIVSLLCASRQKFAHITAVEVQQEYADLCERNISLNGLQDKITTTHADIRDLSAYAPLGDVHAVFANPPYMTTESGYAAKDQGRQAARHEAHGSIKDFCLCAKKKLRWGGSFYVVWRPDRLVDLFCAMREAEIEPKKITFVIATPHAAPSMVLVEGKRGGKPSLVSTPFLCLKNEDGSPTKEMERLLLNGTFPFS